MKDKYAIRKKIELLSIIIPVYNEIKTIELSISNLYSVLKSISTNFEVFVVESNSNDGSREKVLELQEKYKYNLTLQDSPKGKGSAVREAFYKISGEVFLIFDGDNEYDPKDLVKLIVPIEEGETSFVLGSRHSNLWKLRNFNNSKVISFIMNGAHIIFVNMINLFFSANLTDPFSMYKIIRTDIFKDIRLTSNRFDLDWELICISLRLGSKPIELPITYSSRSFKEGKKIKLFLDPITWMIALFKFRFLPIQKI